MHQIDIKEVLDKATIPIELLLLADPSAAMIHRYINESFIFGAFEKNKLIGVVVLSSINEDQIEIKNIAVAEHFQGKGIGSQLMNHAIHYSQSQGFQSILIGTADTSLHQLNWYQKIGFKETHRRIDLFINNYPQPIIENDERCRDMVMLEMSLNR